MNKKRIGMLAAILVIICGASVMTACSSNDDNATESMRERVIAFEGIENGRDMGGLVMQDGRMVRFDMLVRSGNLATATDGDVAVLTNRFRLSDVFDFRFDAEVAAAPDRVREPRELRGHARLDRPAVRLTVSLHREPTRLLRGRAATVEGEIPDGQVTDNVAHIWYLSSISRIQRAPQGARWILFML